MKQLDNTFDDIYQEIVHLEKSMSRNYFQSLLILSILM